MSELQRRIERALTQRLYLVEAKDGTNTCREFRVMGSKGDTVYNIKISNKSTCNCMDFKRRQSICKHLIFVLHRVLRVPLESNVLSATELSDYEVKDVLTNYDRRAFVDLTVYSPTQSPTQSSSSSSSASLTAPKTKMVSEKKRIEEVKRLDFEGQECPICYEDMEKDTDLVWCRRTCGNSLHTDCWSRWKVAHPYNTACPFCRTVYSVE